MTVRKVGDRAKEWFGNFEGVITEVHEVPGHPELSEYSIEWDDGQFPDEVWSEAGPRSGFRELTLTSS